MEGGPSVQQFFGPMCGSASGPSLLSQVRAGRIRAVGITSAQPSPIAPDLTPMAVAAPGYEFELWWGMLAPAGTPEPVLRQLADAARTIMLSAEVRDKLEPLAIDPVGGTPEEFADLIRRDSAKWADVVRRSGARID